MLTIQSFITTVCCQPDVVVGALQENSTSLLTKVKKKKKSLDITVLTACSNATLHPSPVGVMPYWGHVTILLCAVNVICWEFSHSSSFTWQALLFIFCSGLQRPAVTLMIVFKNSDLSLRKENINHVCPKSGSRTNTVHPVILWELVMKMFLNRQYRSYFQAITIFSFSKCLANI